MTGTVTNQVVSLDDQEATQPAAFGPKASTLAKLRQRGLPVPEGLCLAAGLYKEHINFLGLADQATNVFSTEDPFRARMQALELRRALYDAALAPSVSEQLQGAWSLLDAAAKGPVIVRSSALVEDRDHASFAGQFESFAGIDDPAEFLTAVRACWASLWSVRALRYMSTHDLDPSELAMAVICQRLVPASMAGGGLSKTADGHRVITASPGLGDGIAQGEVTPDRFVLSQQGDVLDWSSGHGQMAHSSHCSHQHEPFSEHGDHAEAAAGHEPRAPHLHAAQLRQLTHMLAEAEDLFGAPVEIEWAGDESGLYLVQARPLVVHRPAPVLANWPKQPSLTGHPAGVGIGSGRARIISCECQLSTVAPGDVLITKVAGPSLSQYMPQVAGLVAELGGSTSHLASIGREKGIPMVLGVPGATRRIPAGCDVLVDGVSGTVRWKAASTPNVGGEPGTVPLAS